MMMTIEVHQALAIGWIVEAVLTDVVVLTARRVRRACVENRCGIKRSSRASVVGAAKAFRVKVIPYHSLEQSIAPAVLLD
jgi:hypothetical protein